MKKLPSSCFTTKTALDAGLGVFLFLGPRKTEFTVRAYVYPQAYFSWKSCGSSVLKMGYVSWCSHPAQDVLLGMRGPELCCCCWRQSLGLVLSESLWEPLSSPHLRELLAAATSAVQCVIYFVIHVLPHILTMEAE